MNRIISFGMQNAIPKKINNSKSNCIQNKTQGDVFIKSSPSFKANPVEKTAKIITENKKSIITGIAGISCAIAGLTSNIKKPFELDEPTKKILKRIDEKIEEVNIPPSIVKDGKLDLEVLKEQKEFSTMHRFSTIQIQELERLAELDLDFLVNMLEAKKEKNEFKYSFEDISKAFELKEKYPQLINEAISIKDSNRYHWEKICEILEEDYEFAKAYLNIAQENKSGSIYEYLDAYESAKEDKENAIKILQLKNSENEQLIRPNDLKKILDFNQVDPELLEELIKRGFDSFTISKIDIEDKELLDYLTRLVSLKNFRGEPRLDHYDIESLLAIKNNRDEVIKLLELKTCDGEYRIDHSSDIKDIISLDDYKKKLFYELLELKNSRGKERFDVDRIIRILNVTNGNNTDTLRELLVSDNKSSVEYSAWEITSIFELENKYPEIAPKLLKMKNTDGTPRFTQYSVEQIAKKIEKYPYIRTLLEYKTQDGNYRFGNDIEKIIDVLGVNDEKIKHLVELKDSNGNYRLNGEEITKLASIRHNGRYEYVLEILNMKNQDGSYKYNGFDAEKISFVLNSFEGNELEFCQKLIKMEDAKGKKRFDGSTIWSIISNYSNTKWEGKIEDIVDAKLANGDYRYNNNFIFKLLENKDENFKEILDKIIDKCYEMNFDYNELSVDEVTGNYIVKQSKDLYLIFDKEGNFIQKSLKSTTETDETSIINSKEELNTNNLHSILESNWQTKEHAKLLMDSEKIEYDSNGNILFKERYIRSKDIPSKYEIWREDANGRKYKIGSAEKTPNGTIIIEKALTSINGTKNQYVFIEDPQGQRLVKTRIIDKDGNILFTNKQVFKKINENHFISIENGVKYDIRYYEDKVVVTKDNGEKVEISIGENGINTKNVLSKDLLEVLKQLPGSIYFKIDKYKLNKIGKEIDNVSEENAHYSHNKNIVSLSNELAGKDGIATLLHELGHYIDRHTEIYADSEILATYEKERKELFNSATQSEIEALAYFVSLEDTNSGGAITELIAETNALLYSNNNWEKTELRGELLLKYFPETFSLVAKKLTQD